MPVEYIYKMTSEMTQEEIQAILQVARETFRGRFDEVYFRWKYFDNPYGDSLHMIAYDGNQPVACSTFWRNDLGNCRAYQSVDSAVLSSHQRRGIYREAKAGCMARLKGAYLYSYPNYRSGPILLRSGWSIQRRAPLSVHLASVVLRRYEAMDPIPDNYALWRFVQRPRRNCYIYRRGGQVFLLSQRRKNRYAVAGLLSNDFGLQEVRPLVLFSYDYPDALLRLPGRGGYFVENPCYVKYQGFIPSYRTDTL